MGRHAKKTTPPPGEFEGEKAEAHRLRMIVEVARLDAQERQQLALENALRCALAALDAFRDGDEALLARLHEAVIGVSPKPRAERRTRVATRKLAGFIVDAASSVQESARVIVDPGPLDGVIFSAVSRVEERVTRELGLVVAPDIAARFYRSVAICVRSLLFDKQPERGRRKKADLSVPHGMALTAFRSAVAALTGARVPEERTRDAFAEARKNFHQRHVDRLRELERVEIPGKKKQSSP